MAKIVAAIVMICQKANRGRVGNGFILSPNGKTSRKEKKHARPPRGKELAKIFSLPYLCSSAALHEYFCIFRKYFT
jgi:hypothetical protein